MHEKRGVTTVDWIMSLSIFLLYISWFFIYIQPVLSKAESPESLSRIVQDGTESDIYWTVNKQPLFIKANQTATDVPIIANFNFNWAANSFAFSDNKDYLIEGNKIAFLANITNNTILWLANSGENYTKPAYTTDLMATEDSAMVSSKELVAEFNKEMLNKITYRQGAAIQNFDIKTEETSISALATNRSHNNTYSIAYHKITAQALNSTTYIFANNPQIEGILTPASYTNISATISATLRNYTTYYANGELHTTTNETECKNYTTNYIDYHDKADGISFITQEPADYKTCYSNQSITLDITIKLKNETRYSIILHTGDHNSTLNKINHYTASFGMAETKSGISLKKMNSTNLTAAATLKTRWGYPTSRQFSFKLLNTSGTTLYEHKTTTASPDTNIYAKEISTYVLDSYGNKETHKIIITTW